MKRRLFACLSPLFLALCPFSSAWAVDSVYLGLGATHCKEFSKIAALDMHKPENKEKYQPFLLWISGASTGYENACRSLYNTQCSGKNLDIGRMMVGVREQCNKNPKDLLGDAVVEAWRFIYVTEKTLEQQKAQEAKAKANRYKKKYRHPKLSPPPSAKAKKHKAKKSAKAPLKTAKTASAP